MLLYRGINDMDYKNLLDDNVDSMKCSLDSIELDSETKIKIYNEVHNGDMSLSLDRIIGHVFGKSIGGSCWISTSADFNFVTTEYAIPQSGRYNSYEYRKDIIVIDSNNEMNNLKVENRNDASNKYVGHYMNLSDNNLKEQVNRHIIKALYQNEKSYYYDGLKEIINDVYGKTCINIDGCSNFATGASECLFYLEIPKKDIIGVLNPLEQDLIYAETYQKSIEETNRKLLNRIGKYKNINFHDYNFTKEEMNIIDLIYNRNELGQYYCLINLIPYFYCEDRNIRVDELYEVLKTIKKTILSKITGYKDIPLVDDTIYAVDYEDIVNKKLPNGRPITKRNKHDIIYQTDINKKLIKNINKK